MTKGRLAAMALVALALSSCRSDRGSHARSIVQAFRAFQEASESDKQPALASLRAAKCDDAPTCADRDACIDYAVALLRAGELAKKARALGPEDAGGNGVATREELALIIQGADDALRVAETADGKCRAALARLTERSSRP